MWRDFVQAGQIYGRASPTVPGQISQQRIGVLRDDGVGRAAVCTQTPASPGSIDCDQVHRRDPGDQQREKYARQRVAFLEVRGGGAEQQQD